MTGASTTFGDEPLLIVGWFGVAVGTYFLVASLVAGGLLIAIAILLFSFGCIWISKLIK